MKRRAFLKSCLLAPAAPIAVASTESKPVDKYDDPDYGNWWKTADSIFTQREIEMMCREWGWIHVEKFHKKYGDHPHHWICQAGVGYFTGIDGNEYATQNTFRTMWYETNPYDTKAKEEFKPFLKSIAGDYYGRYRDHYYFYDVILPKEQYHVYDAYKYVLTGRRDWYSVDGIEDHGKKIYRVILFHMGVSHGKMWAYNRSDEELERLRNESNAKFREKLRKEYGL